MPIIFVGYPDIVTVSVYVAKYVIVKYKIPGFLYKKIFL